MTPAEGRARRWPVDMEAEGTDYLLWFTTREDGYGVGGVSWPDGGWSMDLSDRDAPPGAVLLRLSGLPMRAAGVIAEAIRRAMAAPPFRPPTEAVRPSLPGRGESVRAWTVEHEGRGTRYRLVLWGDGPGVRGVAWPDARWSIGDLSQHAPPDPGWLASCGLLEGDAEEIASVLEAEWSRPWPKG